MNAEPVDDDAETVDAPVDEPWGGDSDLRRALMAERFGTRQRLAGERAKTPAEKRAGKRREATG